METEAILLPEGENVQDIILSTSNEAAGEIFKVSKESVEKIAAFIKDPANGILVTKV